jgi:hypothetical protein
MDRQKAH